MQIILKVNKLISFLKKEISEAKQPESHTGHEANGKCLHPSRMLGLGQGSQEPGACHCEPEMGKSGEAAADSCMDITAMEKKKKPSA